MKNCFKCNQFDDSKSIKCKCERIDKDTFDKNLDFTFASEDIEIDIDCDEYKELRGN